MLNLNTIRRAVSVALGFIALISLLLLGFWPDWAELYLHSRSALALFATWCIALAAFLHPAINNRIVDGYRCFRDACSNLGRDNDFW